MRELRNCIEYLAYLDKKVIEDSDLPFVRYGFQQTIKLNELDDDRVKGLLKDMKYHEEKYIFVLQCLEDSFKHKRRIGRRSIVQSANENEIFLSENEIRGILNVLKDHEMVYLSNGRGGTQITALGIKTFNHIKTGLIR